MHGFWRTTIAAAAALAFAAFAGASWQSVEAYQVLLDLFPIRPQTSQHTIAVVFLLIAPIVVGAAAYALVTHWTRSPAWRETRCRKCNHILRGITEPRCPECGERI
jgi:hypothetical protein